MIDVRMLLRNYLDEQGRLKSYPSKRKLKNAALLYLARLFEPGRIYTEQEVNALLETGHTFGDVCLLRRELYNLRLLDRKRDGSEYRLGEQRPGPEELGLG